MSPRTTGRGKVNHFSKQPWRGRDIVELKDEVVSLDRAAGESQLVGVRGTHRYCLQLVLRTGS